MERTFNHLLKRAVKKHKIDRQIESLVNQKNNINEKIDKLRVENETDSILSSCEDVEHAILPFIANNSDITISSETELNVLLSEDEKAELIEKIEDFYEITIPEDAKIKTLSDLVLQMEKLK